MKILVSVDVYDQPESLVELVLRWAALLGGTIDLSYVTSFSPLPAEQGEAQKQTLEMAFAARHGRELALLEEVMQGVPPARRGAVKVTEGRPADVLLAESAHYDLLAIGTHGRRGIERLFLGSVAERLVRQASCPVLVLRHDHTRVPHVPMRVLLPVDIEREADNGARWLDAHPFPRTLDAVYVLPSRLVPATPAAEALGQRLQSMGLEARTEILPHDGHPAEVIASWAEDRRVDLVVVDHHARGWLDRLAFGSVTERLTRLAPCPVLVAR